MLEQQDSFCFWCFCFVCFISFWTFLFYELAASSTCRCLICCCSFWALFYVQTSFSYIPVSWEWCSCLLLFDSNRFAFALLHLFLFYEIFLYDFDFLMIIYFISRHIDTHDKSPFSQFPCPGSHDHVFLFELELTN